MAGPRGGLFSSRGGRCMGLEIWGNFSVRGPHSGCGIRLPIVPALSRLVIPTLPGWAKRENAQRKEWPSKWKLAKQRGPCCAGPGGPPPSQFPGTERGPHQHGQEAFDDARARRGKRHAFARAKANAASRTSEVCRFRNAIGNSSKPGLTGSPKLPPTILVNDDAGKRIRLSGTCG